MPRETMYEELKRYVRFTEDDSKYLAALRPVAAPHFERIAREFYERAMEHEDAHAVFTGEQQVQRLRKSLVEWMDRLLRGPHDEAYFEETAKIGRIHVRVGLPQKYMFSAMALIRRELCKLAATMGDSAALTSGSLDRALDLELAVMLETYRDAFVARIQRAERRERAEVDRALARMEHRYTQAVELSRVLVVGLDEMVRVRMMNKEAERVTGYARDEALGMDFVTMFLPEGLQRAHGGTFRRAARGESLRDDVIRSPILTRAGKTRDVEWQLAYARSEADDEVVLFAIGRDTTDEDALAARVLQSEKLAAVGTLAAGLAHEIRNPLNGAKLHVTFLERGLARSGGADPDMLDALRTVRDEIARLSGLVTDFLDFARPRQNHRAATSMRALCERAAQVVRPEAAGEGVRVDVDLPTSDIVVTLDAGKMEQVVLNLVRNAIESTGPAGGGTVTIRVRRETNRAILEVEDNGPGLSEPTAPIFDPFFSTKPRGTGLGLSIVHRIVSDHGGTITFESRPGHTVFRVMLPIQTRESHEAPDA